MRYLYSFFLIVFLAATASAGEKATYAVNGGAYEGYFVNSGSTAPSFCSFTTGTD